MIFGMWVHHAKAVSGPTITFVGQGPTKVIMVHDTPPYGHAPKYQI
jgi:hypothetical protein